MWVRLSCFCVLLFGIACVPARADEPARPAPDLVRIFRFHAAAQAEALGEAVERASFDDKLKDALRQLVRAHLARVDEDAGKVGSGAPTERPLDDVLDKADKLARDFNDRDVADWLDAHPAAYQPVQEQIALAEACGRSLATEPEALVRAAAAAGVG